MIKTSSKETADSIELHYETEDFGKNIDD